jgi:transcriptional regulator with XRE-family HTH domain
MDEKPGLRDRIGMAQPGERKRGGTFIRAWRQHRGYTIDAAADAIGSTGATLSRIERGLQPYNQDLLESLAVLYDCQPHELVGVDPESAAHNVVRLFDHVSVREQQRIYRVVEAMVEAEGGAGGTSG